MIDVEDFIEEAFDFITENWKPILIFIILILLGIASILYQTEKEMKNAENQIKDEATSGIVSDFTEIGVETSKTISDPSTRATIIFLWWFLGVMFVLMIILIIVKAFEPIYEALNPWNIAKRMSH